LFFLNFLQITRTRWQSFKKNPGWKIQKGEGPVDYWLISTGEDSEPGINGALQEKATDPLQV
jgi:hypothetical protein